MALRLRNNIDNLNPEQLLSLRHAFRAVQQIQDERGYNYHAGKHGLPNACRVILNCNEFIFVN